jgi:ATP-dependent DNA ligase
MLARPDRLPRGDYSFEVKWDGFRALVSTKDGLRVRSQRGWSMTELVPALHAGPESNTARIWGGAPLGKTCRTRHR